MSAEKSEIAGKSREWSSVSQYVAVCSGLCIAAKNPKGFFKQPSCECRKIWNLPGLSRVCCRVMQRVVVCCSVSKCIAVCCRVLQCVAVHCHALPCVAVCCMQCVAVCYSVLQSVAVCCSVLQCVEMLPCVAVCCRVLPCVAVCCRVLPCVAVCCRVLPCVAVCCCVLPCVAVCCRVLSCVAVYCSVLQCVAVCCSMWQFVAVCCSVSVWQPVCWRGPKIQGPWYDCTKIWNLPGISRVWSGVLQCVAVCCSELQRIVVCSSKCVAAKISNNLDVIAGKSEICPEHLACDRGMALPMSVCVIWLIHMCDTTHSYVIGVWHRLWLCVRYDSLICVPWLIHIWSGYGVTYVCVCDMTDWYVWHDSIIYDWGMALPMCVCLKQLMDVCVCVCVCVRVWHNAVMCVSWLIHMWLGYGTANVFVCDMAHSYVWHDSIICGHGMALYI